MAGTATRGTQRSRLWSVLGVIAFLLAASAVAAEDGGHHGGGRGRHGGGGSRTPDWNDAKWYPQQQDNRRLISPMGSAANLPPGYYQQNMGWSGPPLEPGPVIYPAPLVMYVGQPLFPTPQPEPQPPVVVVNQVTVNTPPPAPPEPAYERPRAEERQRPAEPATPPAPKPTAPQKVFFDISPGDALVKLDGKKLGTAADLAAIVDPLQLSPGVYILQVEHPSYRTQRLVFGVSAELVRVEIDLASDDPSSRARVR